MSAARAAESRLGTQTGRMSQEITFKVDGRPPAKSAAPSLLAPRHPHTPRVLALLSAAREEAQRRGFQGCGSAPVGLALRVACRRDLGRSDATNYLGGVGDVLEDKAHRGKLDHLGDLAGFGLYANDRQIDQVRFLWEPSESPSYTVRLWALDGLTRASLKTQGFVGWVPFRQMLNQDKVPRTAGIYVVARSSTGDPKFREANQDGRWVAGAEVVYIGRADELRRRLRQFADLGAGKPVGHSGGRLIWQLAESRSLLVAWKETPGDDPKSAEAALIADFLDVHGKPPFANEPR